MFGQVVRQERKTENQGQISIQKKSMAERLDKQQRVCQRRSMEVTLCVCVSLCVYVCGFVCLHVCACVEGLVLLDF